MIYIETKYRRANHVGEVRKRLADMIVAAFAAEDIEVRCDPKDLWPAQGYWRQIEQDVCSWEGCCEVKLPGRWIKKSLCSWDRMSSCIKGLTIGGDGFGYEIYATNKLEPSKRFKLMRQSRR